MERDGTIVVPSIQHFCGIGSGYLQLQPQGNISCRSPRPCLPIMLSWCPMVHSSGRVFSCIPCFGHRNDWWEPPCWTPQNIKLVHLLSLFQKDPVSEGHRTLHLCWNISVLGRLVVPTKLWPQILSHVTCFGDAPGKIFVLQRVPAQWHTVQPLWWGCVLGRIHSCLLEQRCAEEKGCSPSVSSKQD